MTRSVTIQTGSRLHFGLLAHRPELGRDFGGAGLMIDSPGVKLTARAANKDDVQGPEGTRERVREIIANYRKHADAAHQPCEIEIEQTIPAHQGLGSGTQLAMAIAKALSMLADEPEPPRHQLARWVARGHRSALGIHGFQQGGFLVDGGKRRPDDIGALVARMEFPSAWRIVLITPPLESGLSGTDEQSAFRHLAGMPEATTNQLCRLILMDLMPALLAEDFAAVSESIYQYGQLVGRYFQPVQGGTFACSRMGELAAWLRQRSVAGVGQSSWGPTIFVLAASQDSAEDLLRDLKEAPDWTGCEFHIAAPLNRGAFVTAESV